MLSPGFDALRAPAPAPRPSSGQPRYVERVRFVICSSFLLSPSPAVPSSVAPLAPDGSPSTTRSSPLAIASCAIVLILALGWPKTKQKLLLSLALVAATIALVMRGRRIKPEAAFVAEVERLIASAQSFDVAASRATALVRDVECVSRGLVMCVRGDLKTLTMQIESDAAHQPL